MTVEEFKSAIIDDKAVVACENALQRNETLRFLDILGFSLSENSKHHIEFGDFDEEDYLCPGVDVFDKDITCWRWRNLIGRREVDYADVPFSDMQELYVADEDEFSALFANLMA